MKIIDRYVGLHVIGGTAVALALLVALFSVVGFIDDADSVGRGDYTMGLAVQNLVLLIPGRVFSLLPASALIGSLLGLGILTSSNELTVLRAAGVSVGRITAAVLKSGALLVVLAVVIGELIVPPAEQAAYEKRSVALSHQIKLQTKFGLWIRDRLSFINIRSVLPDSRLADIYIYEFDKDHRLRVATHASRAEYISGRGWMLEEVRQSTISPDGVQSRSLERAAWHSLLGPDQVNAVPITPEALSAAGLLNYIAYLEDNGLSAARYELALWNKFVYPFATGVMVFVSVVLVLGPLRMMSLGRGLMVGIVIGIVFHIVQQTTLHIGLVFEGSPVLTVLGPPLAFLLFGVWLMRRVG